MNPSPLRSVEMEYAACLPARPADAASAANRPGAAAGQRLAASVEFIPYSLSSGDDSSLAGPTCELVGTFGEVEAEYASIRRGAGIFDSPHRGTILVTGAAVDRREFLNRMVTQELKDLGPGVVKEAFWLNRKGRIDADLMLIELGDRMLIDVDIHQAAHTVKTLSEFVFSEDVQFVEATAQWHHVAVHGPLAIDTLVTASGRDPRAHPDMIQPWTAMTMEVGGVSVIVARRDQAGEIGLEIIMPRESAVTVWRKLVDADITVAEGKNRVRPIGWHAFNMARIEAGTPLFNIDFGATNLPHETGILRQRVSFTKGCYLGQEVVARMESRGHSKSNLVGLRMTDDALPIAGAQIFESLSMPGTHDQGQRRMGEPIGVVTSSTLSPMLSAAPVAFAMIRAAKSKGGSIVLVNAEGGQSEALVTSLQFWPRPATEGDPAAATSTDRDARA